MAEIKLFADGEVSTPAPAAQPENWYVEPFTKRKSCQVPGQCGGDCDCGCPYNNMTEVERLPLIADIAPIFPNEWLAFIISPAEDDEFEPIHGKLVAHSPIPDEVYDAVNTVLWNQHVYVCFNGDFETMKASYGPAWDQEPALAANGAEAPAGPDLARPFLSDDPRDLVFSALDHLYGAPNFNEAIRRLRLARVWAASQTDHPLIPVIDAALDKLETAAPPVEEIIWDLEDSLAALETI